MMKVLQVNVDGWFYGRPMYVFKLSKLLLDRDVDCKIIGASDLFEKELKDNNITNIKLFPRWKPLERSLCSILNLYRVVQNEKPDLIHSHGISENIIMGIMGNWLKIPVLATYHTNPFNKYKNERQIGKKIRRFLYELLYISILTRLVSRNFAYIMVISKELRQSFIEQGYNEKKIKVGYFGVDTTNNNIKLKLNWSRAPIIIFVGRLSVDKGCDCLLRACKILAKQGESFKLYLVGNGNRKYFLDMAIKFGLKDRVFFTGFQRDFASLLVKSDIFVLPSRGEGLPISILEAMAYGLPIIATKVGGIPELIDEGKNGFLIPSGDAISLADAIRKMIKKGKNARYIIGLKNREKIEKLFSSRKMIENYLGVYKNMIKKRA